MTETQTPADLDRDELWSVVDAGRASLADLLDDLSEEEWRHPSLCAGWTVRDVAAHLTQTQQLGLGGALAVLAQWRGTMNRTIAHAARRRAAAWSTARIAAELRSMVGLHRRTVVVTPMETMTDVLVHSQDIAVPLGRHLGMPPRAAAASATRTLAMRYPPPLPSVRKVAGFQLTATDIAWTTGTGTGPEVRGPMSALLLVCCGRTAALPQLTGHGLPALTASLTA